MRTEKLNEILKLHNLWSAGALRSARADLSCADLPGVVVPFGADGKARCARLELLEIVEAPPCD